MNKPLTLNGKFKDVAHLQALEGNPLTSEDLAMFEMFEREGWSCEQGRNYILAQITSAAE